MTVRWLGLKALRYPAKGFTWVQRLKLLRSYSLTLLRILGITKTGATIGENVEKPQGYLMPVPLTRLLTYLK